MIREAILIKEVFNKLHLIIIIKTIIAIPIIIMVIRIITIMMKEAITIKECHKTAMITKKEVNKIPNMIRLIMI